MVEKSSKRVDGWEDVEAQIPATRRPHKRRIALTHRRLCFMPSIPNDIPRRPWTLCPATGDTRWVSNALAPALSSLADSTQHLNGVEDDDEYMCWLSFELAYNGPTTVYGHIVKGECPSFNHSSDLDYSGPKKVMPDTCHRHSTQRRHQFCSDFCKYKAVR